MPRRLPASTAKTDPPAARPRRSPRAKPFIVLLVDDEPQVSRLLGECITGDHMLLLQARSLDEARKHLAAHRVDLVLIEPNLARGEAMTLTEELAHNRRSPQTIVITGQPSLERAMDAIRVGAAAFMVKPLDMTLLNQRVREAMARRKAQDRHLDRLRRLRSMCQELRAARQEVTQQVDILCNDLVTAYQELATQMQSVVQTSEFAATIKQELDLEQMVRKVLEYLLDKAGPTNAALFLPTGNMDYALGGYVNYDCSAGSSDLVLQHLADILAPRIAKQDAPIHLTDNQALTQWLGDDAAYLADCHVLGFACCHAGEPLAIIVLFRDAAQPFDAPLIETVTGIAPTLAEYLARIIRVHHRHLS